MRQLIHIKRVLSILLIVVVLIPCFIVPEYRTSAKTLGDLEAELRQYEADLKKNQEDKEKTNQDIATTKANIDNINATIKQIGEQVKQINEEIVELGKKIEASDKEIKAIINFLQIANGESEYLEYAFGAQTYTDFIYRVAVTEQLSKYNEQLINEFNDLIKQNNQKKEDLRNKESELNKEQENLKAELAKLGNRMNELYDISVDLDEQISVQRDLIQNLKDRGCNTNDDINTCGKVLPNNTRFWRPVDYGQISSYFGNRCFWLNGKWTCDFHTGLDISGSGLGSNVYATASGTVAGITYRYHCGGNYLFIHHKVNGQYYTSMYMHLLDVYVQPGDHVDRNTVIGAMGGDPSVTWWDGCSTGAHVHFSLLYGLVGTDYWAWSGDFYANLLNPQDYVNTPGGVWWNDRYTWY